LLLPRDQEFVIAMEEQPALSASPSSLEASVDSAEAPTMKEATENESQEDTKEEEAIQSHESPFSSDENSMQIALDSVDEQSIAISTASRPDPPSILGKTTTASADALDDSSEERGLDAYASRARNESMHGSRQKESGGYYINVFSQDDGDGDNTRPESQINKTLSFEGMNLHQAALQNPSHNNDSDDLDLQDKSNDEHASSSSMVPHSQSLQNVRGEPSQQPVESPYRIGKEVQALALEATLPNIEEHPWKQNHSLTQQPGPELAFGYGGAYASQQSFRTQNSNGGKRKIRLRLQEDVRRVPRKRGSTLLGHLRRRSSHIMFGNARDTNNNNQTQETFGNNSLKEEEEHIDRGTLTISWFEGTSSLELQEHVKKTVLRKLNLEKGVELADFRILDESSDPPEGTYRQCGVW
jgi:hypothetical protein